MITRTINHKQLRIKAVAYEPARLTKYISVTLRVVQFAFIILVLAGIDFIKQNFPKFVVDFLDTRPNLTNHLNNNKTGIIMVTFIAGTLLINTITHSPAFEVYVGDQLIFSKMESHYLPHPNDLIQQILATGVFNE